MKSLQKKFGLALLLALLIALLASPAALAAEELGVSKARVYKLIDEGSLSATRLHGTWAVERRSVEARKAAAPGAGRPRKRLRE